MGRPSQTRTLHLWMNGVRVGEWRLKGHQNELHYDRHWVTSDAGRPLSLSLPMPLDDVPLKGDTVGYYFDNLLPDSQSIRKRLQSRFGTQSQDAFDLLAAIGRDCVGAAQLLPPGETPADCRVIDVEPLAEADVANALRTMVAPPLPGRHTPDEDDYFRISIAGAQEKSAFTWHNGRWCRPRGATPTTHIFKLPLGLVGNRQADMRSSVENEWLCAELLHEFGLPIVRGTIAQFEDQKVLVLPRFDRRLAADASHWLRLPQEDFCQALGCPPERKYESDGGPGMLAIANILQTSEHAERDLQSILKAQVLFWLLAATDGHAKNFSIQLLPQGRFRLTPLYDVLSAWPVIGDGPQHLDYHKLKLAMAVHGKSRHYSLKEIQYRHFLETARRCGYPGDMASVIAELVEATAGVIESVAARLPAQFPAAVFDRIGTGLRESANRLGHAMNLTP